MIVRMKKVTLLCIAAHGDETLGALRNLGVMHLSHARPPAGDDLDKAREKLAGIRHALGVLQKPDRARPSGRSADDIVQEVLKLLHRKKERTQLLETLRDEDRRIEPYGSFEPAALRALAEKGIYLRLYHAARGVEPAAPADAVKVVLRDGKEGVHFVVISRVDVQVDATELRLPEQSLNAVRNRITGAEKELAEIEARLKACSYDVAVVVGRGRARRRGYPLSRSKVGHGIGRAGIVSARLLPV